MILLPGVPSVAVETPTADAPAPPAARQRLTYTWIGSDGVEWDLSNGPVRLARGAAGFGIPKPQHRIGEAAALDGATWEGVRIGSREVFLPVHVRATNSDAMLDLEGDFFAGLDPRGEGVLRVTTHRAASREIRLRYDDGGDVEYEIDPVLLQYAAYPLRFLALDPYWHGEEIVSTFPHEPPVPFFPGPPFTLGAGQTLRSATVTNPGDVEAYPVWRLNGPFSGYTVGVGESLVTSSELVGIGEWVEIDMRPDRLTIVSSSGDEWLGVIDVTFAPIPPGEVELTTVLGEAAEGAAATLTFTPRYRRAW